MKFYKSLSIYTSSNFFNSGVSFLMLPVVTSYLTPQDYGYLSIITPLVAFVLPFISILSSGAIQQSFYKMKISELKVYISSSYKNMSISLLLILFIFIILFVFARAWIGIPSYWFLLIPFLAFGQVTQQIVLVLFQSMNKAYNYAIFNVSSAGINMGLGILFIAVLEWNWKGRIISWSITYLIFTIAGIIILYKQNLLCFKFKKEHQIDLLKFGLPIIPHTIGTLVINMSDKLFIAKMINASELGVYNVGYQIAMIIGILSNSFVIAYVPKLYEALKENTYEKKAAIVKMSYYFIAALIVFIALLYLITPLIFDFIIGESFVNGAKYVIWISISYLFLAMYKMVAGTIFYYKKTIYFTYLSGVNIGLNIPLNYYLILNYGAIGAAYATIISNFVLFVLTAILSNRIIKFPWRLKQNDI